LGNDLTVEEGPDQPALKVEDVQGEDPLRRLTVLPPHGLQVSPGGILLPYRATRKRLEKDFGMDIRIIVDIKD